jgi:hypothetical protein
VNVLRSVVSRTTAPERFAAFFALAAKTRYLFDPEAGGKTVVCSSARMGRFGYASVMSGPTENDATGATAWPAT